MSALDEILSLQEKLKVIVKIEDRDKRAQAGKYLEWECRKLDDEYRILGGINDEAAIELRAIVQVIFDYILFDDFQDKDWQQAMPSHFDGDIQKVLADLKGHDAS